MNCTATDPSPTPEATLFTEPWRTSPTAKRPGTFVSKQERISVELPALRVFSVADQVGAGQNESVLVTLDEIGEPIRSRRRADENEHRARRDPVNLIGVRTKK